jgi:hypothetical protein
MREMGPKGYHEYHTEDLEKAEETRAPAHRTAGEHGERSAVSSANQTSQP